MSASESKERLLAAAKALTLANGFSATTVDAICKQAGLTKGSFYHFFKSKDELGLAVLEWSLARGGELVGNGPHARMAATPQRTFAFLKHLEDSSLELWADGCLLSVFALELAGTNDDMQQAVSAMFTGITELFAAELAPLGPASRDLAGEYLTLLEGSVILAKAYRDPSRIATALRGFRVRLASASAAAA